jgi:hypothetical protein
VRYVEDDGRAATDRVVVLILLAERVRLPTITFSDLLTGTSILVLPKNV